MWAQAAGGLKAPKFGPLIDSDSGYDGQSKCSPGAKPGVVAFQSMVLEAYPGTGAGSIGRDCSVGGQSEHKEGRAWDWGVNAGVPSQKKAADDLIKWLTAEDEYGNDGAMARRLGIMYLIWNRKIWFPWDGWDVYCEERKGACRDPHDNDVRHPHTDHVHFSFTWEGARKQTSFWNPEGSKIATVAAHPEGFGFWVAGRNGTVITAGTGYYGSKSVDSDNPVVAMAATATGDGYWLASEDGKVWSFGDAAKRGSLEDDNVVGIAGHTSTKGYWLLSRTGKVSAFGRAKDFGSAWQAESPAVSIAATSTGRGYWVATETGEVFAFGDATDLGGVNLHNVISLTPTHAGVGYWLTTASGKVRALGDATSAGSLKKPGRNKVVGFAPTPTGQGYYLIREDGTTETLGDA